MRGVGDALRVEHPAGALPGAQRVGAHQQVGLVGGRDDRAGCGQDHGHRLGGGLAGAGGHDLQDHVLPGAAQVGALGCQSAQDQPALVARRVGGQAGAQRPGAGGGPLGGQGGKVPGAGQGVQWVVGRWAHRPAGSPDPQGHAQGHPQDAPHPDQVGRRCAEHVGGPACQDVPRGGQGERGWVPAVGVHPAGGRAGDPQQAQHPEGAPDRGDEGHRGGHLGGHPGAGSQRCGAHQGRTWRTRVSVS